MENGFAEGYAVGQGNRNDYCYPPYAYGNNGGGFGFGGEWGGLIGLLIVASLFGNGGWGFGGGNNCRGECATQADLAAGFNNSAVLSKLNDLSLGQAGIQQTLCQGFSGVNATVNTVGNTITQGICNLGYTTQAAFHDLSHQLSDCCCATQRAIDGVRYDMSRMTCDIVQAGNANTQRIIDLMNAKETQELRDKLQAANFQISQINQNAFITANQEAQTAELIRRLGRDCPIPAYVVPNPNCCYTPNGCCGNI